MAKKKRRWYYVSYYEEYPIYEPAEGGYYYAGNHCQVTHRYGFLKRARKAFKTWLKEFEEYHQPLPKVCKNVAYDIGTDYVGTGRTLRIETVPGIQNRGYVPYE